MQHVVYATLCDMSLIFAEKRSCCRCLLNFGVTKRHSAEKERISKMFKINQYTKLQNQKCLKHAMGFVWPPKDTCLQINALENI